MKLLLSENEIKDRVKVLGMKITKDYEGKKPIFIGILNGCYVFMADLLREVELDVEVDFVKIRSYEGDSSTGTIKFRKDISADIDGRDVIIVEDIIDSGKTIEFIIKKLENINIKSFTVITLLKKNNINKIKNKVIDWYGFNIKDKYVIGYGLDINNLFRELKDIYIKDE